ncbi:hypothetical protein HTZ77_36375 [Nonomuraea sp. SMC257]|uniref:Uncharacterized protein n=1 Tax=Nonomuraea montanisoli TaxID=2741721 RepID=A0A7Y6M7Y4_9ACTN|nr:hypothetical protein [Nonomuraea montanisoli]NUW36844.1 hypothetical protein [Nonomuraea montanisoli]
MTAPEPPPTEHPEECVNDPEPVLLERRYRAALRLLPASYRAEREEEMVAAFLEMSGDVSDEGGPRPRWGEIASVAALAVRVRLGGAGARAAAWGETVRLVALLGLAFQAMMGLHSLVWLAAEATGYLSAPGISTTRFLAVADVLWLVAFAAAMRGFTGPAKPVAVAAAAVSLVLLAPSVQLTWTATPAALMVSAPVLALLAGFHDEAPVTVRPWRHILLPVAATLLVMAATLPLSLLPWAIAPEPVYAMSVLIQPDATATVACAVTGAVALRRGWAPSARLALAVAATLLLAWRLPSAVPEPGAALLWVPAAILCGVLAVVIVPLAVTGTRLLPPARRAKPGPAS